MVPCPECARPLDDAKLKDIGLIECVCENKVVLCPLTETPVTVDEMPLTEYLGG